MAQLAEHPSVKRFYEERKNRSEVPADQVLDAAWLRLLCLDAGADDVGFVERWQILPELISDGSRDHGPPQRNSALR